MVKSIISLIFLLIGPISFAQTIRGVVQDTANIPVSYATVMLYLFPDTTYVSGTITDTEGKFELKSAANKPLLSASLQNIVELPGRFIINLDAEYNRRGHSNTSYFYKDSFLVDGGISKNFWDDSLQVKVAVSDIFNQNKAVNQIMMPHTDLKNIYCFDRRTVSFTLRYSFNFARSKYKGTTAGEEAVKRF